MVEQVDTTKKRERSPEYPAFDLEEALNKARVLYEKEKRNPAPIASVLKDLDYSTKSGAGLRAVAALEKFGLVAAEGSGVNRKVRLADDGFNIIIDQRPNSPDRDRLIQEAALRPTAHAGLWSKYGKDLPSDDTLRYELRTRGFTEGAAQDFIREYKATLVFAKLRQGDILTPKEKDNTPPPLGDDPQQTLASNPDTLKLPIARGEWALLQAAFPLTEEKWDRMFKVLEAMKPALVAEPEREHRSSEPGKEKDNG